MECGGGIINNKAPQSNEGITGTNISATECIKKLDQIFLDPPPHPQFEIPEGGFRFMYSENPLTAGPLGRVFGRETESRDVTY
jgi:hypothetical protein